MSRAGSRAWDAFIDADARGRVAKALRWCRFCWATGWRLLNMLSVVPRKRDKAERGALC
jgi:hypothetical protein